MRVAIIGACYYMPPSRFAQVTSEFVGRLFPEHVGARKCFVNMRASAPLPSEKDAGALWMNSSGSYLDISAYASAAEVVGSHDLYLILNDTLFTKHPWRLIAGCLRALVPSLETVREPAAAGEVHPSTDLLLLDVRNPTRRHLSTFCFLLNSAGFQVFQQLLQTLPRDDSRQAVRRWLDDHAATHPPLRHLLHVHLTGPVSPWSWKAKLNAGTSEDLLLRKAVTVAFEYLLSEQFLRRGGLVMPINIGLKYRLWAKVAALVSKIGRP